MMRSHSPHLPVLLSETLAALRPRNGGVYLDGTFGRGGHSRAILQAAPGCRVYALDRDPDAVAAGRQMAAEFGDRLTLIQGRFGDMAQLARQANMPAPDGVLLDIGVSSPQLETPSRGFSFMRDGPLDMRMDKSGPDAAMLIKELPEQELTRIFRELGEEPHARRIARAIVAAGEQRPIRTTLQLAEIIRAVSPRGGRKTDPCTRIFQALRIYVNDELGELARGLRGAETLLKPDGRLAVISFHSLEDRCVKRFLRDRCGEEGVNRHIPAPTTESPATFRLVGRGAIKADKVETAVNPRARSARLRVAERTDAPARTQG